MDPKNIGDPWVESNSNLPREYVGKERVVSPNDILAETYHTIDVAYYDRTPGGEVYVETDKKTYKSNSIGHTGPEPGHVDTLVIGCSLTSGIGLHFEQTWGYKVAQSLGGSYASLAFVGGSVSKIVRNATEYMVRYGKPKRVLMLAPDFMRVDPYIHTLSSAHKYYLVDGNDLSRSVQKINMIYAPSNNINGKLLDCSFAYAVSSSALHEFIRLCELSGIEIHWATWATREGFGSDLYRNYIHLDFDNDSLKSLNCHQDISAQEEFAIATDNEHHGAHYHQHVAEAFISRIKGK